MHRAKAGVDGPAIADEIIRDLAGLRQEDRPRAGRKAAGLGEVMRSGVAVPPGFVVDASAFAAVCVCAGLRDRIAERLASVDVFDRADLRAGSAYARGMVWREPLPPAVEAAIRDSYRRLCAGDARGAVAVRSSAIVGDPVAASRGGTNQTILNVRGANAVVAAVRSCWACLFGPRSIVHRAARGLPRAGGDIAVIVQAQVVSECAGVLFTVDPAGWRPGRVVIEAAFGLGQAVVEGRVSPDRYVLDGTTLRIVERVVGRKAVALVPSSDHGVTLRELDEREARRAVLTDDRASELAAIGIRIHEHFGAPQEVEWAIGPDGAIWVLETRHARDT
jgi:pyruvate,water dikinase